MSSGVGARRRRELRVEEDTRSDAKRVHLSTLSFITQEQIYLPLEGEANTSVCRHFVGTVVREHLCTLAPPLIVVVYNLVFNVMASKFVSKSVFTPEEVAKSPKLEPALCSHYFAH